MAITCHFITSDFKLKSNVLTTAMFPHDDAKTAENIRKELQKELVSVLKFDPSVMSKVVWVTDQGSNIVAALRPYWRLDCQDHIYNKVLLLFGRFLHPFYEAQRELEGDQYPF